MFWIADEWYSEMYEGRKISWFQSKPCEALTQVIYLSGVLVLGAS